MKYFVVFAAIVAIATASPVLKPVSAIAAELQAIVAAIKDPNTEPATANLLQHILEHIQQNLSSIGQSPVSVGPAIIDFPLPDGGAATAPVNPTPVQTPIQPSPVVVGPIAPGSPAPLVQIIINVKSADGTVVPIAPVVVPEVVDPVNVVEDAVNIEPVNVVEAAPVPVEPVIIGTPILPSPAVNLPEELN